MTGINQKAANILNNNGGSSNYNTIDSSNNADNSDMQKQANNYNTAPQTT